jgi:hypothetical protein
MNGINGRNIRQNGLTENALNIKKTKVIQFVVYPSMKVINKMGNKNANTTNETFVTDVIDPLSKFFII